MASAVGNCENPRPCEECEACHQRETAKEAALDRLQTVIEDAIKLEFTYRDGSLKDKLLNGSIESEEQVEWLAASIINRLDRIGYLQFDETFSVVDVQINVQLE